jgi:uncharacterized membrane protein YfcA
VPHLTEWQWGLAIFAALCVGLSKAGFSGLGLIAVVCFASIFGARDSTGIVLPMLIVADIGAVVVFKQHARWDYLRRTLPLAAVGVVVGALIMSRLDNAAFRPVIGVVILALTGIQLVRLRWPDALGRVPHSRAAAWSLGALAGVTTMMANAAGPLVALYCVAVQLPKFEIVGTLAWFFFIINLFKVPFSVGLGVIHGSSLALNAALVPAIIVGLLAGRWLIARLPQRAFETVLLVFAAAAAVRLLMN